MSFPLFKFTLTNQIEGTLEIKEPEGWDDGVLKLERNKEYHSLVEYYEQPLTFDDAISVDIVSHEELPGGMSWIKNIEETQGINANIGIEIEISEDDGDTYESIFIGRLAIDTAKEIDFYKLQFGVIRDDFWAKLMNRKSTPVSLSGTTDLDGNSVTPIAPVTLELLSQKLREQYVRNTDYNDGNEGLFSVTTQAVDTLTYLIFDGSRFNVDEIDDRYEYGTQISDVLPTNVSKYIFKVKFGGTYRIQLDIKYAIILNLSQNIDIRWFYAIRSGSLTTTQIGSTNTVAGNFEIFQNGTETLDVTINLTSGDEIYVYGRMALSAGGTATYFPDYDNDPSGVFSPIYTSFSVTADTIYKNTETPAYTILNATKNIIDKIANGLVSSSYLSSGCGSEYLIMNGVHLRGYSITEKLLFQSFDDIWKGLNPIFNLGMGYIQDSDTIEIAPKSEFYDSEVSIYLDFVNNIERSYTLDYIFKTFEIGYEKWSAESSSGIDDPQTKRVYRTIFEALGKDEKMLSKYIAAGGAIEETRRQAIQEGKDWKFDDETFIINAYDDGNWKPYFTERFNLISNLLNEEFRYNIILSATRNLDRWRNYINGCLQVPSGQDIIFSSGQGNYDMTSQLNPDDCEASDATPEPVISEKGNFEVTDDILFTPITYTFEHPLTHSEYNLIRNNRKKSIAISRTDSGHKAYSIQSLSYKPTRRIATFEVLFRGEIQ